ncbi:MAG: hypothetical protein ACJ8BW_01365 [Ktedonobacteraceae bacterium]
MSENYASAVVTSVAPTMDACNWLMRLHSRGNPLWSPYVIVTGSLNAYRKPFCVAGIHYA